MGCKTQKFFFEAGLIRFGREHCRKVTTVADVTGSLAGTYFDLNAQDSTFENESMFYVWYNTGTTTDPAVAGKTGIEVGIDQNDSASLVASKTATAIEALSNDFFRAKAVGSIIDIGNRFGGQITEEEDSGSTGFTFSVGTKGIGGELGRTADGIELSLETEAGVVNTNQTGSKVNAEIHQGQGASLKANFVELDEKRLRALFSVIGDELENADGSYLIGGGESKLFQDLSVLGGQLVVHPQRLPISDVSKDLVLWSSAPKPDSLNFDGTSLQQLSTSFTAYLDERYKKEVNLYCIGKWTDKSVVDA